MLPDLEKSHQSGKKVLPEMAKSPHSDIKVPMWRKRIDGFPQKYIDSVDSDSPFFKCVCDMIMTVFSVGDLYDVM